MGHKGSKYNLNGNKVTKQTEGSASPSQIATMQPVEPTDNKKYPLPVEACMLRRIQKRYHPEENNQSEIIYHLSGNPSRTIDDCDDELSSERIRAVISRQKILIEKISETLTLRDILVNASIASLADSDQNYDGANTARVRVVKEDDFDYPAHLIHMPFLVAEKILHFLNPGSILALRATCTATKAWIDRSSSILKNFQLRLDTDACAYNRPPTTAPWTNFSIPFVHLQSEFIQDTIDNYGDIITSLEISPPRTIGSVPTSYPPNHPRTLFEIIKRCPKLENLNICRLDSLTQVEENCLGNLRTLCIDRIQWMNHCDFQIFEGIIVQCPHLEYLKIPQFEILGSLAFIFYDANASPEKEHLIRPIIRYLDRFRNPITSSSKDISFRPTLSKSKKLYIDVVEFEDFKLCSSEIFYELSRKCLECNAVLMNVYFVPRDAVFRNQQDIVESFASMFGFIKIDFHAELWKNLEVMECWIEDFPDDFELTLRQLSFLRTIAKINTVRSLTIRLSVDDPDICSAALEACVGQVYGGIQKLILRRHPLNPENKVRIPPEFGNSFVNVKYLYLQEIDSTNEDFRRLWPNLPNLVDLFVYKCPYLTQDSFLGEIIDGEEKEPPILQMTKLQVLVIFLYEGVGGFNDQFLLKALRLMKLKGFALRGSPGVEFTEEGMMSLLNSPLHDTLEDFEAPSMLFRPTISSNYWNFYIALPKKELRRNRIWLSCSVLLNSLSSRKHPYDIKKKCLGI